MKEQTKETKGEATPELKELVIARLDIMPPNFKLSIGNKGTFDKQELMEHVKKGDDVGKQIIEMQVNFIRALTSGRLTQTLTK